MIVIIEHGKGTAYPSVWLAKSKCSKAKYNVNTKTYFAMYHTGELPPNYPMPAIRYVADWFKSDLITDVVIFRVYTNDDYELPEVVAHYT